MNSYEKSAISGKDIVIPDRAQATTPQQRLRELANAVTVHPNSHDHVLVLITACISEGIVIGSEIVATVASLGFTKKHVGLWLSQGCGPSPEHHHWYKDEDKIYRLHG